MIQTVAITGPRLCIARLSGWDWALTFSVRDLISLAALGRTNAFVQPRQPDPNP